MTTVFTCWRDPDGREYWSLMMFSTDDEREAVLDAAHRLAPPQQQQAGYRVVRAIVVRESQEYKLQESTIPPWKVQPTWEIV